MKNLLFNVCLLFVLVGCVHVVPLDHISCDYSTEKFEFDFTNWGKQNFLIHGNESVIEVNHKDIKTKINCENKESVPVGATVHCSVKGPEVTKGTDQVTLNPRANSIDIRRPDRIDAIRFRCD